MMSKGARKMFIYLIIIEATTPKEDSQNLSNQFLT